MTLSNSPFSLVCSLFFFFSFPFFFFCLCNFFFFFYFYVGLFSLLRSAPSQFQSLWSFEKLIKRYCCSFFFFYCCCFPTTSSLPSFSDSCVCVCVGVFPPIVYLCSPLSFLCFPVLASPLLNLQEYWAVSIELDDFVTFHFFF